MISIKDYATEKNISTQAVYKQLKLHNKELNGHIIKVGGKKMLDDYAVDFLSALTADNPVVISDRQMKQELERLRMREAELLNELNQKNNVIIQLQEQRNALQIECSELKNMTFFQRLFKKF